MSGNVHETFVLSLFPDLRERDARLLFLFGSMARRRGTEGHA